MAEKSDLLRKCGTDEEEIESMINKIIIDRMERAFDDKKIIFFVGAGISVPAPSKMPDFNKLNMKVIKTITNYELDEEDYKLLSNNIRPEVMYQIAIGALGSEVLYSVEELEGHEPNYYHYFLAEAIRQGNWVFTTNPDNLIEIACKDMKVDFKTYYGQNDDQDFKEYLSYIHSGKNIPGGCIFKLHGSIEEAQEGINKYRTIRFALRQVGEGLFGPRKEVLKYFLKNFDFLFIGYRCRDDFSVFPVLEETKSSKDTFWFHYDDGPLARSILGADRLLWEIEKEENKSLDKERDLDLLNIDKVFLTRSGRRFRFNGNLGKFIEEELCPLFGLDISHSTSIEKKKRINKNFAKWAASRDKFDSYVFIGRLFEQVGQRDRVEQFYKKALAMAMDDSQRIVAKISLADFYYKESISGKEIEAIDLYEQCIESSKKPLERASLMVSISNIQRRQGKDYFSAALQKIEEAKKEFESILGTEYKRDASTPPLSEEDKVNYLDYARCLNVYGLILYGFGRLHDARNLCLRSAEIKSILGDVDGIGESENAISITLTQEGRNLVNQMKKDESIQKFFEAIEHAKKALDSRRKIGNFRGYAQNCRNIAWPYSELMKQTLDESERQKYFDEARNGYKAGISSWNRLKNPPPGEVVLFSNLLARLYIDFYSRMQDRGQKKKQAREIAQEIVPMYRRMILEDPISKKIAKGDRRTPTAENNLKEIKNLLEEVKLYLDVKGIEMMLKELS